MIPAVGSGGRMAAPYSHTVCELNVYKQMTSYYNRYHK